ncbi:hypothetical protein DPSP01_001888 [Paraphaeosphaeria sporulosa]|uniref:Aldo/keto reductase n=1 Tax=Paraphaeosphaeria sporulosa TaxID=1460663 RepID=A0A177C4Y7_9PLEO|nr:Aldo/keto reductase [Paraphaeosphaeria sporulosa]OAG01777.1 Aldo/keto reductase [Paraphaeosphaeria sporulosa]
MAQTHLKVVLGAMTFGPEGTRSGQVTSLSDQAIMLDAFQSGGYSEIDTARLYNNGHSESMLAQNDWQKRGLAIATKLYPTRGAANADFRRAALDFPLYDHSAAELRRGLEESLKALAAEKTGVDVFYLHAPDRNTPYEETLKEMNKLHEEGRFGRFGLSNYPAWEVAQISEICIRNNWVRPTVYQGVYNVFSRKIEDELVPCLRHYKISFYAYAPLAGGLMTGKYSRDQTNFEPGSRFAPGTMTSRTHRPRYWNDLYFDGIDEVKAAADKHGLTLAEVALRWLNWHSKLEKEIGDAVVVGASSMKHLEQNLRDLGKAQLPEEVLEAVNSAYSKVQAVAPAYYQ